MEDDDVHDRDLEEQQREMDVARLDDENEDMEEEEYSTAAVASSVTDDKTEISETNETRSGASGPTYDRTEVVDDDDKKPPASTIARISEEEEEEKVEEKAPRLSLQHAPPLYPSIARAPPPSDASSDLATWTGSPKPNSSSLKLAPGLEDTSDDTTESKRKLSLPGAFPAAGSFSYKSSSTSNSSRLGLASGIQRSSSAAAGSMRSSSAAASEMVAAADVARTSSGSIQPGAERVHGSEYLGDSPDMMLRKSIITPHPRESSPPPPMPPPSPPPPPPPTSMVTPASPSEEDDVENPPSSPERVDPPEAAPRPRRFERSWSGFSGHSGHSNAPMLRAVRIDEPVLAEAVTVRVWMAHFIYRIMVLILLGGVLAGLVIIILLVLRRDNGPSDSILSGGDGREVRIRPTLETIIERGRLRCGVQNVLDGFSIYDESTKERVGFEIDLCKAIAAAIFGEQFDPTVHVEPVVVASAERWTTLADKSTDIITRTTTHTMERDVYQQNALSGFTFSVPYIYEGLGFAGIPPYPSCADQMTVKGEDCNDLKICTFGNSTHSDLLRDKLPTIRLFINNASYTRLDAFVDGRCNVIAGISHEISEVVARKAGYSGAFGYGEVQLTKEPLALVTRQDDPQWSNFVNIVLQGLMEAERQGVTKDTAHLITTHLKLGDIFGEQHSDMLVHAIRAVGNYGDMYERHIEPIVPRKQVNTIRTKDNTTGILYAMPFGRPEEEGPSPVSGGTLERIGRRGYLKCGILMSGANATKSPLEQLNRHYCRAVSGGLFSGVIDTIAYILIPDDKEALRILRNGDLDVLAGASALKAPVNGVVVSAPYYYHEEDEHDNNFRDALALATRSNDPQWSDFVFWAVTVTHYSEEQSITAQTSNDLPGVELFGPSYDRMLRDIALVVDNTAYMYKESSKSLSMSTISVSSSSTTFRGNLSTLNDGTPLGPQFYPLL